MLFGRLLNRAIFSHLMVAVPPALILGLMVIDINERALRTETQRMHLSLAAQLRDALEAQVDGSVNLLGHAERILDLIELSLDERQNMLRALIADGRIPYLALYTPEGTFDSVIRPRDDKDVDRRPLPEPLRDRALSTEMALLDRDEGPLIIIPWRREDEIIGFVGTALPVEGLLALCTRLTQRHLGPGGQVDVVAADGRYVASSEPTHVGAPEAGRTPLSMVKVTGRGGLMTLAAGIAGEFPDSAGDVRLGAVVSAPELGWLVAASRPANVAFASLERVRTRVVLMSVIAALVAGLVGLLMARQISGPVHRLIAAVRRAAKRGFAPDTQVKASGELGKLASTFNHALAQLAEYRRQVRQTTQLRLRLSRFSAGSASARELLARAGTDTDSGPPEPMTVLYADVMFEESTALATEHLVTILGEFFSAAHEAIRQEGGRIDQYSGDAVIGLFPAAFVQSPVTAALTAATTIESDAHAITERWAAMSKIRLHASVGVVTGQAHLAMPEDGQEPTAHGPLIERAATLQRVASAGRILVDTATADAASVLSGEPLDPADGEPNAFTFSGVSR